MSKRISIHGQWSSGSVFVLAALGASVGLGNVWYFPFLTVDNGGGAFLLAYLVCMALVGLPLLMTELVLGKCGRQSPIFTLQTLIIEAGASRWWSVVGWVGIVACVLTLSYYSVIAGWSIAYLVRETAGVMNRVTAEGASTIFSDLVTDPERMLAWHTVFMVLTIKLVSRGVTAGLEKAARILVPLALVSLLVLLVYAARVGELGQAYLELFGGQWSQLDTSGWLAALAHAFFTLSLGMGALLVYGTYLPENVPIASSSLLIVLLDTLVGLVAGLIVLSLLLATGLDLSEGAGLLFQSLPIAFGQMPAGGLFGAIFFLMLLIVAWTSTIVLAEPVVTWLIESRQIDRIRASIWVGLTAWALGIVTILSFSGWSYSFEFAGELRRHGLFDVLEILTSSIMLPLGGLGLVFFAGWVIPRELLQKALGDEAGIGFRLWYFVIRFISPAALLLIFLQAMGVI